MIKDREIFEYYGNRASVTMNLKDNKLKTYIHDYGGWIFDTKNVVVALYVLKDKTIKDLISNSLDDTKIISILDSKLEYDKELIINSLEEDGDLQWISWLTKNYFDYGNDKEYIYSIVTEDFEEQGYDYDGLILDEGGMGGYGEEVVDRGLSYVVFSPEQVKSVDNKNPTKDEDYRYSYREKLDELNSQLKEMQKPSV